MWDYCGMARNEAEPEDGSGRDPGAARGVLAERQRPGGGEELNQALEKAGRVADFLELGELLCLDALDRNESCGGHFREEYQTPDGEAQRDDEHFCLRRRLGIHRRRTSRPVLHKEPLVFEEVAPPTRSYK